MILAYQLFKFMADMERFPLHHLPCVIYVGVLLDVLGEVKSHVVMKSMSEYISYKIVKFISPLDLKRPPYTVVDFLCFSASNKSYEL